MTELSLDEGLSLLAGFMSEVEKPAMAEVMGEVEDSSFSVTCLQEGVQKARRGNQLVRQSPCGSLHATQSRQSHCGNLHVAQSMSSPCGNLHATLSATRPKGLGKSIFTDQ